MSCSLVNHRFFVFFFCQAAFVVWFSTHSHIQSCILFRKHFAALSARSCSISEKASTSASLNFKCLQEKEKQTNKKRQTSLVQKYTKKVGCLYRAFQKPTCQFDILVQSYLICQNIKIQLPKRPYVNFVRSRLQMSSFHIQYGQRIVVMVSKCH